jgi:hypothetical protein
MITRVRRSPHAFISALVLALALAAPTSSFAQPPSQSIAIPVVGTVADGSTFSGVFNLTRFAVQNGQVVAVGTVSGILTSVTGVVTSVLSAVVVPTAIGQATCDILHLDLGPLFLDVLGLQVNLSRVVLDITAVPGAGNLLGNLLCAVAGLLDNPNGLARILNDILRAILG